MQILIDVEKDYYEMLKYNVEHGQEYKPFEIIANGIPVTDDMVSRAALKEVIAANHYLLSARNNSTDYGMFTTGIMQAIDNAPVVDPTYQMPEDYIKNKLDYSRPQGKWIKIKEERMSVDMSGEIVTRYKCSKCGRVIATFPGKLADYYPFCHCGAKMTGGAENER